MIVTNKVQCDKCKDIIESKTVHNFNRCKCGNIAVDGGKEYLKRIGHGITDKTYTELSVEFISSEKPWSSPS